MCIRDSSSIEAKAPSIRVFRAETRLTVYCAPYISNEGFSSVLLKIRLRMEEDILKLFSI